MQPPTESTIDSSLGRDPGYKTPERRVGDVTVVGDNWGENSVSLGGRFYVTRKKYLAFLNVLLILVWLFVCGVSLGVLWLTVAVFLTKNPNLTLSKF